MAPPLVTKLPKVTEYVRNIGKSVQYATVDYFKGSMSETSDFIETNQELFKDIAAAAKNYKGTLRAADRSIRQSKIYEAGTELKKTLFESIRTGKFYDPEREAYYQNKAGGSLGDMSDMDDWGFDTDQFDIDSGDMSQTDSTNLLSSTVKDATTAQANVIAKSSEYLAEMNKANTRLLFAQGEKTYAAVSGGFAGTQSMLDQINKFLQGPLTTHMENSKTFYEQTNKTLNEMSANLKELTEMQRNLYKREQKMAEESQFSKVGASPDLKEYSKQLYKNFMDILGPEAQMVLGNDMGEGSNMLMALVANPLQGIPNFIVKSIVPVTIKKSLETLDASFSNLFANFIARMNKAAGSDNIILQYLGRLFGLKLDKKTTYDSSKYEKGPVPFDGITRKTIVDIIPGHLARIEAALTGKTERVFDYETGKWTTAEKLEKDFRDRKRRNVRDAFWDSGEEARDNINRYKRSKDKAARDKGKELEKAYEVIINKIYEDGGVFEPYKPYDKDTEAWEHFGLDKDTFLLIANWMIGSADDVKKGKRKRSAYGIAPNVMQAQESFARYMRDMENKGYGNVRHLYSNAYDFSEKTGSKTGNRFSNVINESFDKYGKNVFWYLRGIYAELQTIRQNSGYGGSRGRKGRRPNGPTSGGDPLKNIESRWDAEIKSAAERAKAEEEAKNAGSEDTDVSMLDREVQDQRDLNKGGAIGKKVNNFLDDLLKAGSLGQKFKVIQQGINELTKKPGLAIAGVIDQADKRIFNLLFGGKEGQEIVDKDGNRVKGFLDYIILKTRETFDKMNDWLDENILNPLKEKLGVKSFGELFKRMADRLGLTKAAGAVKDKVKEWARPTVDRMKEKMGWGWNQFKGSMGRTYGAAWDSAKAQFAQSGPAPRTRGRANTAVTPDVIEMGGDIGAPLALPPHIAEMAYGGLVTRRGLAVISPGEKVVPVGGRVTQRNNLVAERAFARRLGLPSGLSYYAKGTNTSGASDEELENAKRVVKQVTNEVMGDTKHKGIANVIASSLLGGGFSLLTGMIGGPLLGAAAGAAFGIAQNSGTVQNLLFGDEVVDKDGNPTGERKGGLISADLQKKFKKYFPSMRDFGLAGAVAGLFTPFGLIGGLMAGSAIGFAKENEGFQEWLFGKKDENGERDGGVISKQFRDKVKKAAPRMLIGAAGAALLGPFGLIGNAALGSALGLATTTDQFHKVVFGEDDGSGKKKGGIVPAIYRGIVKPLYATGKKFIQGANDFFKNHIEKHVKIFLPALLQMVKTAVTGIGDHVKDFLSGMFERTIGRPLADFLEHSIFDRVRKVMGGLLKAPLALAKGVINAPFAAMGFIGNNIRSSQIAKGTAGDMTAQQRLDWRNNHRFRVLGRELNPIGHDKFRNLDEKIAGMQGQEGIDKMKELKTQMDLYLNTRKELGRQAAQIVQQAGEVVSEFFNYTMCVDDSTKTLYQAVGAGRVKKIHEAIAAGKTDPINRVLQWAVSKGYLDPAKIPEFMNQIGTYITRIAELREKQKDSRSVQNEAMSKLSRWSGGTLRNAKNIRRFSRLLSKEIDTREAEEAKARATQEEADASPEGQITNAINEGTEKLFNKTNTIIDVLRNINAYMAIQAGETDVSDILQDTKPGSGLSKRMAAKVGTAVQPNGTLLGLPAPGQTVGGTRVMDDVITADPKDAVNAVNNGLHTIETDDGHQGLMDANGRIQPTQSGGFIKRWLAKRKKDQEDDRSFSEKLRDSLFGKAAGVVGGVIGKAKDGLFGLLGSALSKISPMFDVIKWVFLGATAVAAVGHGSDWFKVKVMPFLKEKVGPWLIGTKNEDGILIGGIRGLLFGNKTGEGGTYENGLISGLTNKFFSWYETTPIYTFFTNMKKIYDEEGLVGFVKPILNWYASGGEKFLDNILTPLVAAFVKKLPQLIVAIGKGVWQGIKSWFSGEEPTGDVTTEEDGSKTINTSSHPERYKSSTTTQTSLGSALGLKNTHTNTFFTDQSGNSVWADQNGNIAVRDSSGNYIYEDGTPAPSNTQFHLVKENEYSSQNHKTLTGMAATGLANNFLATATGMRSTANRIGSFAKEGIIKNAKQAAQVWRPFRSATGMTKLAAKGAWNAAAETGNKASSLGAKFRQWVNGMMGHNTAGKVITSADATDAYNSIQGMLGSVNNGVLALPAPGQTSAAAATGADLLGDAASATNAAASNANKGGILSRIKSSAANFVSGIKDKVANTSVGKKVTNLIDKAKGGLDNLVSGIKDKASSALQSVKGKLSVTKAGQTAAGAADDAAGFLAKIKNGILKFFNGLAENKAVTKLISGVAKIFGTSIDDVLVAKGFKTVGESFAKKIGENAAKSALKSAASALASIPIFTIVMAVGYFTSGWNDAHTIFGIAKDIDIPIIYNVIAGLVNAVKNCLPGIGVILSFIDTSDIINLFTDVLLPIFGWDNSGLKKLRDESQKYLDEWNANADEEDKVSSIEEYNDKAHPGIMTRIGNSLKSLGESVGSFFTGNKRDKTESGSNRLKEIDKKNKKNKKDGKYRRGFGHLYQGDPRLENIKFGNSTLGKAGCAPVAAANLMGGNLAYTTRMAERYQTSDGGVTPDYFANTLGGAQTDSKKSMLSAIKAGRPTVLLGNSGREHGTPFGANDHYITAMGMDRKGNIIVDDPDLPGNRYKYPASRVMRDTTTGVITGMRRGLSRRRGFRRRYGFGPEGGDPTDQKQTISKIAVKAYQIIHQSEGNYGSINGDDNGSLSIGKIQWHGARAHDLMMACINAVGQSRAQQLLGSSLYNEIVGKDRNYWHTRKVNKSEGEKISALISTEEGKGIQDLQGYLDIENYISVVKGYGITDENAIVYFCDMYNQSPAAAQRVAKAAIKAKGSASSVRLDDLYNQSLVDSTFSKYSKRRTNCYNMVKSSTIVGNGTVELESAHLMTFINSTGSTSTVDGYTGTGVGEGAEYESQLANGIYDISRAIFGNTMVDGMLNLQQQYGNKKSVGRSSSGLTFSRSIFNGGVAPANGYGVVGSPTQQGLVDQMASIKGKINYSLDWDKQDPDIGVASCASTVGWAYRKVLGLNNPKMSASSTDQSKDSRFRTLWTNQGAPFSQDSMLQPGDVMYFNWDRTKNNGTMQHTEMYAGNSQDWSHGGEPQYGPVLKDLGDYRRKHLMMVRRYNGFLGNDSSGSSRRRGYARAMTSGVNASISDNAKRVISQYGISTSSQTPKYGSVTPSEGAQYNQFLAVIIDLLAAIADNTNGLTQLQKSLSNRGVDVDYDVLEKAAANARKRSARARSMNKGGYSPMFTSASSFNSGVAQDLLNSPTGFMVQAMEALAIE